MQVILLKDIKNLGVKNSVINVKDGYALNFLIPQGLAAAASEDRIKQIQTNKQSEETKRNKEIKEIEDIIKKISGKKIIIKKQASDKGKLFAAVSVDEILSAIEKVYKIKLDRNKIKIKEHIKEVGEHEIVLKVENKNIDIEIEVLSDKE